MDKPIEYKGKHCMNCGHFRSCYPIPNASDSWPGALVGYFKAIRMRDLCINNNRMSYISPDKMCHSCNKEL